MDRHDLRLTAVWSAPHIPVKKRFFCVISKHEFMAKKLAIKMSAFLLLWLLASTLPTVGGSRTGHNDASPIPRNRQHT
jgi:hypothetical protein